MCWSAIQESDDLLSKCWRFKSSDVLHKKWKLLLSIEIQSYYLSRDHKPTESDEAKRIESHNGRIDAFKDTNGEKIGPLRVWLKEEDIPGLAMTRSFGDSTGAEAGVICVPEIKEFALKENDKFVIVGSDGIWEFISNDEAAAIVYPFYLKNSAEGAADALVKEAQYRWKQEEDIIDDITCIIAFLDCI
jgi:serine/threonine protein phosphatase PrpC